MRPKRCAHCNKTMPPVTPAMRKYCGAQIDEDPFCSAACAKKHHKAESEVLLGMQSRCRTMYGPTLRQKIRQAHSERRRQEIRAAGHSVTFHCDFCGKALDPKYLELRRFCSPRCRKDYWNRERAYHGRIQAA